ncbi:DUF1885 family protein [Pseudalkalibacillus hwajinpoensis]|uniref:DUF1885 family protein n=1 Tax=Guptibacillus hwajinpoensis TaxID=208199 RepID=UPI00325A60A2
MPQSAYLIPKTDSLIELNQIKDLLHYYVELTTRTGKQLSWSYEQSAFPYTLIDKPEAENNWFYLKGITDGYHMIIIGLVKDRIQVVLPDQSTHGDKAKANELCKFLANKITADLILFNGRTMYYSQK